MQYTQTTRVRGVRLRTIAFVATTPFFFSSLSSSPYVLGFCDKKSPRLWVQQANAISCAHDATGLPKRRTCSASVYDSQPLALPAQCSVRVGLQKNGSTMRTPVTTLRGWLNTTKCHCVGHPLHINRWGFSEHASSCSCTVCDISRMHTSACLSARAWIPRAISYDNRRPV